MPTYEYVCTACGHEFETLQSMKDEPLKQCPKCKKKKLKRLIGRGAGIIFKGSGFYQTDYKNTSSSETPAAPKTKLSEKTSESSDSKSSEVKAETPKPAEKASKESSGQSTKNS